MRRWGMPDAVRVLADRLQAAFDTVSPGADPVLRPSDRADFQANGALPLGKQLSRPPREVAEQVVAAADLDGVCSLVEVSGPGFINLRLSDDFIASQGGRGLGRPPPRGPEGGDATDCAHRLLLAQRGQGDARGPPAHHEHRRRAGPSADVPGPYRAAGEPHRRLGDAVRHADRAPAGRGRRRQRRVLQRARPERVLRRGPRPVRPRSRVRGAQPAPRRPAPEW